MAVMNKNEDSRDHIIEQSGRATTASHHRAFSIMRQAGGGLHYDLQLELGGVMKSWAIPQGPSLDPSDKRLAVHVDDQPLATHANEADSQNQTLDHAIVTWDKGYWEPFENPEAGYRKGQLSFFLSGRKFRGSWRLVRIAPKKGARETAKENWLLIKSPDDQRVTAKEPLRTTATS